MSTSLVRSTAAAGVAMVLLALGACSEDVGEKVAERLAEEQLSDGAEVDVDTDTGEVRVEDGEGNSYVGGNRLPNDFPAEIPLLDGEILTGAAIKDGNNVGWSVSVQADGGVQTAFDEAVRLLEGAGFELVTEVQVGVPGGQLDNGTWGVVVAVYGDPSVGTSTVAYTVGDSTR